jgi:uncharacterized protein (TIGR03437 family)
VGVLRLTVALLACYAISAAANLPEEPVKIVMPMALGQTRYQLRAGESAQLATPQETLNFVLQAKSRSAEIVAGAAGRFVIGPSKAHDQVLVATSLLTPPGEYTVKVSATSAVGEKRETALDIVVSPRQTVPSGSTRSPVVLLNGWETGYTGSCPVSSSSSDTFGNLAQYLVSDGVPIVYFFDNCVEGPNDLIEDLGYYLGQFLNTIKYDNGTQVPQIDLVAHSMGGLIVRSYLAGLQANGALTPPTPTLVGNLVMIAVPNFGSFVAGNYLDTIEEGTQSAELIPGSSFLWNLATWNQRGDDMRGVNAIAIVGNAGSWTAALESGTALSNASDGVVSLTSGSLGFVSNSSLPTEIVPYCQVDPVDFINTSLGTMACDAVGIANVTSDTQYTGEIVRSFLAGTTAWKTIGGAPSADPYLSVDGGIFFAAENEASTYIEDISAVSWGTVALLTGGDTDTVFYDDFIYGTDSFTATSESLGSIDCAPATVSAGYYTSARCKIAAAIFSVGPLASAPGRVVSAGSTITINGFDFGDQCQGCQVTATPAGATTAQTLTVSSWTTSAISVLLPATLTGLVTLKVTATYGSDYINIMAISPLTVAVSPSSLQFAYTAGGATPSAQSIALTNSSSLSWTATASESWLTVSPASGAAGATLSVSVSPSGLSAGTHTASIQITASGASNSPVTIAVTLTVTAAAAVLSVSPQSLTFNYTYGVAAPAAQSISISYSGSGSPSWTASNAADWVSLSATSGSVPGKLSVSVNPANLAAGTYTSTVPITVAGASGSPASVAITLVILGTQPAGTISSVVSGADFQAGFASATWVSIFGTNLSQSTEVWQASDFVNGLLPTSLDGVSVTINGIAAYVEYISPTQINVLAPDDSTTGTVQVQVTAAKETSNSFAAQKQQFAPAFFTIDNGAYIAAVHLNGTLVGKANLLTGVTTQPAAPAETIELYGTGFGPTSPATPTADLVTTPAVLTNSVQVTIGGVTATVGYAGLVESGLYQFNVTVPSTLASGDAAVVAEIGGVKTQTGLSITVGQ